MLSSKHVHNMVLEMIGKDKKRDTCNIGLGRDRPLTARTVGCVHTQSCLKQSFPWMKLPRSQPHLEPTLTRACLWRRYEYSLRISGWVWRSNVEVYSLSIQKCSGQAWYELPDFVQPTTVGVCIYIPTNTYICMIHKFFSEAIATGYIDTFPIRLQCETTCCGGNKSALWNRFCSKKNEKQNRKTQRSLTSAQVSGMN